MSIKVFNKSNKKIDDYMNDSSNGVLVSLAMRLQILRQMTGLSIAQYCEKYQLDLDKYTKYENAELIIPNQEIRQLISKMFFNNEIFCRSEWVEGYEKIAPVYIEQKIIDFYSINENLLSNYGKMVRKAFEIKNSNPNNCIGVVSNSLMGKIYTKGTLVVGEKYDLNNENQLKTINNVLCIIKTQDNVENIIDVTYNNGLFFCTTREHMRQSVYSLNKIIHIAKIHFAINHDTFIN